MPIKSLHINALRAPPSHDDAVTTGTRQHNLIRIQGFSITRVTVNKATINLATRKDTALLAFLADRQGRSTDRLELVELLWSNSTTAKGKHSLAQALFSLRRSLGGHALELSKSSVTLLPRFISADFIEFEQELIRQNLSRAAAIFDESFFPELDFDDAPSFNEWRDARAARFYQQFCSLLTLELRRTHEREDWVGVSSILETAANRLSNNSEIVDLHKDLVQRRPTHLASHQSTDSGARHTSAAIADLGTLPSTCGGPFLPERRQQPFVGRSTEPAKLAEAWSSVVAGEGSLVMVSGHAGVGKTSLCNEFVRQVCAAGNIRVLKAQGYEAGQHIGYALLADALKNGIKEGDLARLSPALAKAVIQIMPEWEDLLGRTPTPPLAAEAAQRRLLEAAWQLVVSISKDASVLIWFDDAQWLDNATLSWILYTLRHLANHRILFLVASRYPAALNLWSQFDNTAANTCTKLQVGDLSDEDLFLLAQALRPDISRDQMQLLKRASGGRPILALEWLKPAKEHKDSSGLHFVGETLRSASPSAQLLAELISVAGRPIDIDLLAQVVSRPPHEIVGVLADLEDLIDLSSLDRISFKHDLVRERIAETLVSTKRQQRHAEIAMAMTARGDDASLLAYHYSEAGHSSRALRYASDAAADSERRHAYREAEHYLAIALRHCGGLAELLAVQERKAELLYRMHRYQEAVDLFEELATSAKTPSKRLRLWSKRVMCCVEGATLPAQTLLGELAALEEKATHQGDSEALHDALRGGLRVAMMVGAKSKVDEIIDKLTRFGHLNSRTALGTQALRMAGHGIAITESPVGAIQLCKTAVAWADELKDAELQIATYTTLGTVCYDAGDLRNAMLAHDQVLEIIDASGAISYTVLGLIRRAAAILELGRGDEAEEHLERALAILGDSGAANDRAVAYANLAMIAYQKGNFHGSVNRSTSALGVELLSHANAPHLFALGVRGLALLELGLANDAFKDAEVVHAMLSVPRMHVGDVSPAVLLLARVAVLRRREKETRSLVESLLNVNGPKDFVARLRIQLALAELVFASDARSGIALVDAVINEAAERALTPTSELAERSRRRMRRIVRPR